MTKEKNSILFTDMLLSLMDEGTTLVDALHVLARREIPRGIRQTAIEILTFMKQGYTFSRALEAASETEKTKISFSRFYLSLITSAEATGDLLPILKDISTNQRRHRENRQRLTGALVYPGLIILSAMAGTAFLIVRGLPLFAKNGLLPEEAIRSASSGVLFAGVFLLSSGIVIAIVFRQLFGRESIRHRIFYLLSFLMNRGVSLAAALQQCMAGIQERKAGKALLSIKENITSGMSVGKAFQRTEFFDAYVTSWLSIADESGNVVKIFGSIAGFYEQKDSRKRQIASRFIEPVVIIITGIYLLILIQSAILPVLSRAGGFQ